MNGSPPPLSFTTGCHRPFLRGSASPDQAQAPDLQVPPAETLLPVEAELPRHCLTAKLAVWR